MKIYIVSGCYTEYSDTRLTGVEVFKTKEEAQSYVSNQWNEAFSRLSDEMDSYIDEDGAVIYYDDDSMQVYEIFEKEV